MPSTGTASPTGPAAPDQAGSAPKFRGYGSMEAWRKAWGAKWGPLLKQISDKAMGRT